MNRKRKYFSKKTLHLVSWLMAICITVGFFDIYSYATTTEERLQEAEEEKEEAEAALEDAQGRLAQTENDLANLEGIRDSYEGQLANLNTELQLVADNLAVIEAEITLKQLEIDETTRALEAAMLQREQQYFSMKERIRFLYESGDTFYLELLFSSRSFGEFLNYADYIEQLSAYDRQMLEEYIATQNTISANMVLLEEEMAEMEALRAEVVAEQGKVTDLITDTSETIASTADTIESVEAQAAAYEEECNRRAEEAAAAAAEYEAIKAQYEEELRLSRLAAQSAWRDISQVTFEEGDRYLLANLIYCEAGGEPYEGQVAVGAVVINRVMSSVYPNTVTGVIYQHKQFSPVLDGHLALALAQNRATDSCYAAADAAMSGTTNVGNCVYFRTPIEGLTGTRIGNHIFY